MKIQFGRRAYGRPRICRLGDWQLQCCQASVAADPFAGFAYLWNCFYMGGRDGGFSAPPACHLDLLGILNDI